MAEEPAVGAEALPADLAEEVKQLAVEPELPVREQVEVLREPRERQPREEIQSVVEHSVLAEVMPVGPEQPEEQEEQEDLTEEREEV
jgi:hypothetical protein